MMKSVPVAVMTILLVGGCAHSSRVPTSEAPEAKAVAAQKPAFDLAAMMARELPEMAKHPIDLGSGSLKGEVEATSKPVLTPGEQFTTVVVPLQGASGMTCFLYKQSIDAGGALFKIVEGAARNVSIEQQSVSDVVALGETPAVFLLAGYTMKTDKGLMAGQLKAMVFPSERAPLACLHDEVGYVQSFKRIALGLAKSLSVGPQSSRYSELATLKIAEQPVGFVSVAHFDGKNGNVVVREISSALLPRSQKDLVAFDSISIAVSDKDGNLVSLQYARGANGEIDMQALAEREPNGEYSYKGKHSGKEISGKLRGKGKGGIPSTLGLAKALRKLLSGTLAEVKLETYDPSINPAALVQAVFKLTDKSARAVTINVGEMVQSGIIDEQGLVEKADMQVGPFKVSQERVAKRGAP